MRFFYFLSYVLVILLSSFSAQAKRTCDHIDKPKLKINVKLDIPETSYNFTKSAEQMTAEQADNTVTWLQKQGIRSLSAATHAGKFLQIRGLAYGGYQYEASFSMQAKNVDPYGVYYCPYLTDININLIYTSEIFVAKEIPKNSCEFDEIIKHEWKHHTANLMAFKTYTARLEKDLPVIVREIENNSGYVDASLIKREFSKIQLAVKDMIEIYYDTIYRDSNVRNAKIDTPQEYMRVENAVQTCENALSD